MAHSIIGHAKNQLNFLNIHRTIDSISDDHNQPDYCLDVRVIIVQLYIEIRHWHL